MSKWRTVSLKDIDDIEPVRKNIGHSFTSFHGDVGFPQFCRHCGHVALKNAISEYISKVGCNYHNDHRYKQWRKTRMI